MEEKKFNFNTIIGYSLIFVIIMWMMYNGQKTQQNEQLERAKATKDSIQNAKTIKPKTTDSVENVKVDKIDTAKVNRGDATLGRFSYSTTLTTAKEGFTIIENDFIKLSISNKGGYVSVVTLKKFERFNKNSKQLVELIKSNNANFNLKLQTKDNRTLNTASLFFEPTFAKEGQNQILSMKLKAGQNEYLEYRYVLAPNKYMVDFDIRSQGLSTILNTSNPIDLQWDLKTYRNEKSISYENRYTEIYFEHKDGKIDYVSHGNDMEENSEQTTFIAYKQHFFSSILLTKTPFKTSKLYSNSLVDDEKKDTVFTKQYKATIPLAFSNGELDYKMNWYYGPTDYNILNAYDRNIEKIVPLGWGIFGWINKFIFIPLFGFLSSFMGLGIAIIIFTILIKIAMSPITFKSFLSQAKMKVLRPEIMEIGEKFKKDPMKKQQETMKLYNKAGVNPMAGCIPALIQLPFMYASFQFFPSAFELRQKGFLWADDLSSFDQIFKLPFNIPLYGDHVSLFPILAAIAIFFYMKMTSGDQAMAQPQQEGMPDMAKIMKIMIYVSPIMMLIFFNSYGSGLSLYNFISNLITIGIMLVIKKYFIDGDKIHIQIEENKAKPKKENKFQKKMREMMEQAEAQKQLKNKK